MVENQKNQQVQKNLTNQQQVQGSQQNQGNQRIEVKFSQKNISSKEEEET